VKAPDPMRGMSMRTVKEKLAAERSTKLAKQDRYREKSGGPAAPAQTAGEATDAAAADATPELGPDGQPIKKKRGRPAGTKNRPREVVAAERKAKAQMKSKKKAGRKKA
jgi:hypothetical protein